MITENPVGVLVVFTAKTVQQMLELGGSQSWVINPQSMRNVEYVVCTRNSDHRWDDECGPRPEPHNSAFMVGKVSGLKKVDRQNDRDRYLIQFSEYALVNVPNFRTGSKRNPVSYSDVLQCKDELGLDVEALNFRPMPPASRETSPAKKGLSISEAKEGLAVFFSVPVESVQITISG
ncbi:MAG: hypothetical protein ACJ8FS_00935 [Sphingomicrobium sp.]